MSETRRQTFGTLDGLRGVAALAVAFRHVPDNIVGTATPESYLAVDLFFVLSGFVLAHAYTARLATEMTLGEFLVARLIRLYPLYLVASLITLGLVLVPATTGHYHPPPRSLRTVVLALLFVPTIAPGEAIGLFPLIGPAWSLFFELVANLVFALLAPRLGTARLALVVAAGAGLLIAAAAHFGSVDVGYAQDNLWGGFGRVGFGFFAGVAAYRLWRAEALPWLRLPAWAAVAALLLVFVVEPPAHQAASDVLVILFVLPALVLASARGEPGRRLARPFAVLGTASYAVYVLTNPVDQWFETLVPWAQVNDYAGFGVAGALALVAAIVALALVLDRWYDLPVRAVLTRWQRRVGRDYHSGATRPR